MIRADSLPYRSATGLEYDSGSNEHAVEKALDDADYPSSAWGQGLGPRQSRCAPGHRISPYVEPTAYGTEISVQSGYPYSSHDNATVTVGPTGTVRVAVGFVRKVKVTRRRLRDRGRCTRGPDRKDLEVVAGDTERAPFGLGTYASRGAVIGGGAVALASRTVRDKLLNVGAMILEAAPEDLRIEDAVMSVVGSPDVTIPLADVAAAAYFDPSVRNEDEDFVLSAQRFYDPRPTFSNGCFVAIVEVDLGTGGVRVSRFIAVEDCGTVLNPMIVEGQVRGAVAQGVGAALLEQLVHDDHAQLLTGTFVDYLLPLASDVPPIDVYHLETPSPVTVGGIKGMGESGLMASPAAIINAVLDAIAPYDPQQLALPLTPERILRLAGRI